MRLGGFFVGYPHFFVGRGSVLSFRQDTFSNPHSPPYIARHGDISVELDALPPDVLRDRLEEEVSGRMDMTALVAMRNLEDKEREALVKRLEGK